MAEQRDDARSPLNGTGGRDHVEWKRRSKTLPFGNAEKQDIDNLAWALILATSKEGLVGTCEHWGVIRMHLK